MTQKLQHMAHSVFLTRPSILALIPGTAVLLTGSLMHAANPMFVNQSSISAALLAALVFLVPGVIAGMVAPRAFFWDGLILGVLGAVFVTLQSAPFRSSDWSSMLIYEAMSMRACVSVPLSVLGAFAGSTINGSRASVD